MRQRGGFILVSVFVLLVILTIGMASYSAIVLSKTGTLFSYINSAKAYYLAASGTKYMQRYANDYYRYYQAGTATANQKLEARISITKGGGDTIDITCAPISDRPSTVITSTGKINGAKKTIAAKVGIPEMGPPVNLMTDFTLFYIYDFPILGWESKK